MTFLAVLVCTVISVFLLRNFVRKAPVAFYVAAIAVDVLFLCSDVLGVPRIVDAALFTVVHKCTLALALFVIVMFIGVFPVDSKIRRWLQPIRAELSIVAWILSMGHMAAYFSSYMTRLFSGVVDGAVFAAIVVALVLLVLLLVLGVTSFQFVKRRMSKVSWKRVQLLAYPFFGLVYVHLLLMLLPPALHGGSTARFSVAVYTVIFIAYFVSRVSMRRRVVTKASSTDAG